MSFDRKKLASGKKNPKYVDLLDEDTALAGQKFVCMSFISPDKVLKKRELWLFEKFIQQWDMAKSMEKFSGFLQFLSYKYKLNVESAIADYNDFIKEEEARIKADSLEADYTNFLEKNEERLNLEFNKEHAFQTSTRGLKVRGVYNTQEEAESRCKKLRDADPNHNIYVGPVGIWIPWDPDAYKTGRVEFMEEELNQLHSEKLKNEAKAKQEFDNRVKDTKRRAIEENIRNAQKSGNALTQTIDEDGNLVGVRETTNFEDREVASDDVREEMIAAARENEVLAKKANATANEKEKEKEM